MKIRNAILALGLAIVMSFGFTTNANANNDVITIEEGITGVIEQILQDNGNLIIQLSSSDMIQLSLVSATGQTLWSTKTNDEIITIPVSRYAAGSYTLVAVSKGNSQFLPVQL